MNVFAAYDYPSAVQAVCGEVVVLGPGSVAISITPQAAEDIARLLLAAAALARRQSQDDGEQ